MKASLFTTSILCTVLASIQVPEQGKATPKNDLYSVCIAKIRSAPQDAYDPCRQYLEQSSSDDAKRIQWVKNWVAQYEKKRPYAQFLKNLTTDQKPSVECSNAVRLSGVDSPKA